MLKILKIKFTGLVKISVLSASFISGAASAEECFNTGTYDQAYVPCVSAIDWGNGNVDPGWQGGGSSSNGSSNGCYAYNRDGRDCSFVGYSEGQVGAPWGNGNGQFRCTNGCLQFVGH